MKHHHWQWALVAGLSLVLWGCDDSSNYSSTTGSASDVAEDAHGHDHADGTHDDTKDAAYDHADDAHDDAKEAASDAKVEAESKASAMMEKAQPILDKAMAYLKENKYDLASKALAKLEGMDGLPTSFMDKVKSARSLVDAKLTADKMDGAGDALKGIMGN